MYCPNCGAHNDESYNNCISCGKYIADINKNLRAASEPEKVYQTPHQVQPVQEQNIEAQPEAVSSAGIEYIQENSQPEVDFGSEKTEEEKKHTPDKKYYETIYRQYVKKPKEYFVLSILCTIFGSLGFGIAAIVFSVMTKAEISSGNIKKASIYSQNTRTFCIFSIVIGVIKYLFIIVLLSSYFTTMTYYRTPFMW